MLDIKCVAMKSHNGEFVPEIPFEEIACEVIDKKNIVILKNVFEKEGLLKMRDFVFRWGRDTEPTNPKEQLVSSWHRIDNNPPMSETKHIFHIYNFVDYDHPAGKELLRFAAGMKLIQEALTGLPLDTKMGAKGKYFVRPQVIHYPSGGGFFDWHVHSFQPQKLGLILSVADRRVDFQHGGTRFKIDDKDVGIEEYHQIGDIALFRYDIVHCISPLDPDLPAIDFKSTKGKWSLVLPIVLM